MPFAPACVHPSTLSHRSSHDDEARQQQQQQQRLQQDEEQQQQQRRRPERRESIGRFPGAAKLLRSLGRHKDEPPPAGEEQGPRRANPSYHSEGKGMRRKNHWRSEKNLSSTTQQQAQQQVQQPTQQALKERSHSFCDTSAKRRFSADKGATLKPPDADTSCPEGVAPGPSSRPQTPPTPVVDAEGRLEPPMGATSDALSDATESLYENIPGRPHDAPPPTQAYASPLQRPEQTPTPLGPALPTGLGSMTTGPTGLGPQAAGSAGLLRRPLDRSERRSVRKLTKDSGYETSLYSESDYANVYSDVDRAYSDVDRAYSDVDRAYSDVGKAYSDVDGAYSNAESAYSNADSAYSNGDSAYSDVDKTYSDVVPSSGVHDDVTDGDGDDVTLAPPSELATLHDDDIRWVTNIFISKLDIYRGCKINILGLRDFRYSYEKETANMPFSWFS